MHRIVEKLGFFFSPNRLLFFFLFSRILFQHKRICSDTCMMKTYKWFNLQIAYNFLHNLHKLSLRVMVNRPFKIIYIFFRQTTSINLMSAPSSAKVHVFITQYFSTGCHELILTRFKWIIYYTIQNMFHLLYKLKYNVVKNIIYTIIIYDEIKYKSFTLKTQHIRVQLNFSLTIKYNQ